MIDPDLQKRLDEQSVQLEKVYKSVERIRRYFLILTWVSILVIVLPFIGLIFAVPTFMSSYVDPLSGYGI